jgi:hypothetical protein
MMVGEATTVIIAVLKQVVKLVLTVRNFLIYAFIFVILLRNCVAWEKLCNNK